MTAPRRGGRKRTDSNHAAIRQALRNVGYTVFDTSQSDLADLVVVLKDGRCAIIVEVKPENGGIFKQGEVRMLVKLIPEVYRVFQTDDEAIRVMEKIESEL